ncbi:histidine kinase/PAS domain-containing protein [Methanobacterium formicicum]|uniref:Histidine kinase/PAS domain-containing protein n=1 Tax=Methanobacterium formicicum TaxID=2162 RepID=A0A089ZG40_METFO|nr:histidine kinase/PAS domain-containing protein [Methanobacterium formicicum]
MHSAKTFTKFRSWALLLMVTFLVFTLFTFSLRNTVLTPLYITIVIPIASFLLLALMVYATWWTYKNNEKVLKTWMLVTAGLFLYFMANFLYFLLRDYLGLISLPSLVDTLYIVAYPLLMLGILTLMEKPYRLKLKSFLDSIIVSVSVMFIIWFPLIWPVIEPSQPDTVTMIFSISYLFLDLLLLLVTQVVLFSEKKKISTISLFLVSLGIFSQVVGDMVFAYQVVVPNLLYLWLANTFYTLTIILIALAVLSYINNVEMDIKNKLSFYSALSPYNDWISYLPLVLVLFTYSLLIITTPDAALIWGVGIIVFLVILRQVIFLNDLKRAQITLKRNKEVISKRKEQLDFITSNMLDIISESDANGVLKYVSPSTQQLLGYHPQELVGHSLYELIHPDDREKVRQTIKKSSNATEGLRVESRLKTAEGKYIWIETTGKPVVDENGFRGFIYSGRDITEQKKSAEYIKKSLEEKEALLREIHHRVNNNLQVISSLLSLQSDNVRDPRDHELFVESQNRVRSMAMIHEKLYQSDKFNSINFRDYLKTLINRLIYEYSQDLGHIDLELDIENVELNIETSVPCGLIINELVSNSLKHAFPQGRNGKIIVKFHKMKDKYVLMVGDNGIGPLEKSVLESSKKLGFNLVKSLIKQLDASLEILESEGTLYRITFAELTYQKRF